MKGSGSVKHRTKWINIVSLSVMAVLLCVGTTQGQDEDAASAADTTSVNDWERPERLMATQLVQYAKVTLAGYGEPREDQILRTRILLDQALSLYDGDASVWQMRGELAALEGDQKKELECLRRYVALEPNDDVAQYKLILALIDQSQTLDGRLEKIERILKSERGQGFSEPLRSRLAVYASTAANEIGDQRKSLMWLKEAANLDPSNPEAARLIVQQANKMGGQLLHVGSAAVSLVRALPFEAEARWHLAEILIGQGVFTRASHQFEMAALVDVNPPDEKRVQMWATALACSGEYDKALAVLSDYQRWLTVQKQYEKARELAEQGEQLGALPRVDEVPLPIELITTQLAVMQALPDTEVEERRKRAFASVQAQLNTQMEEGDKLAKLELLWISALFGFNLDDVKVQLADYDINEDAVRLTRGFIAYHENDYDTARAMFVPLEGKDPWATYGAALVEASRMKRVQLLQQVVYRGSLVTITLAVEKLHELGADVKPTSAGDSIRRLMDRYPSRLWKVDPSVDPWLRMKMSFEKPRFSFLEPLVLNIQLESQAPLEFALNTPGALPTHTVLVTSATILGADIGPFAPDVADLYRRLNLKPGESVDTNVRLDYSIFGLLAVSNPMNTIIFNVTGLLDAISTPQGTLDTGLLGFKETLYAEQILGVSLSQETLDMLYADMAGNNMFKRWRALAYLLSVAKSMPRDVEFDRNAALDKIADLVNENYRDWDALTQAWVVRYIPGVEAKKAHEMYQRSIDQAQRSDDVLTKLMYLTVQIDDASNPVLKSALRDENPTVSTYAKAVETALEEMAKMKAEAEAAAAEQKAQPGVGTFNIAK
ncbi:tetratricopeptide repeat protein [Poriferisphaera sp. WC338]|uniref:tetratricopeptide repeat protein n=1 Tax=Poriferisphaera sp. WC338 TaxID=3425129 RepID=UPI003D818691